MENDVTILRQFSEEEQKELLDLLPPAMTRELHEVLTEKVEMPSELIDEILKENCVLFLGAGIPLEAGMPSSEELVRTLDYDPDKIPLTIAAQLFESKKGRSELYDRIKEKFEEAANFAKPERASYPFITSISQLNSLIVTTNYDKLLEKALEKKTPLTISRGADLPLMIGRPHVIVKLHGDIDQPDTLIITQGDYARLAARLHEPGGFGSFLATLLATRRVIFVGFSMADEDFRLVREFIATRMIDDIGRSTLKPAYAVLPWEEEEIRVLEKQLNIKVIRGKAGDFFAAVFRRTSEFLNRKQELRQVCEVHGEKPFVEIVGPAGSGKTMLLKGIETFYQIKQGFSRIVPIELEEDETPEGLLGRMAERYNLDVGKIGEESGRRAEKLVATVRGTVLFTFDRTERAPTAVRWVERELLPRLRKMWADGLGTGRVIFAGRQPFLWQPTTRLHLYLLALTPFLDDAVEEMVEKYFFLFRREMLLPLEKKRIAQATRSLTGTGHAGFIKTILGEIAQLPKEQYPSPADLVRYIEEHTNELLEQRLVPQLKEEILKGAEEPILRPLEDVLCVFRVLNTSILTSLPQRGLDQFGVDESRFIQQPDQLLRDLMSLHLLKGPDARSPMYRLDPVVGFLLSLWLRRRKPELYRKDHEVALIIWDEGIQRTTNHFQLAYALEGLYHLQCLREIEASQEKLADKTKYYLGQLRSAEKDLKALAIQLKEMILEDNDLRWKVEEEARRFAPKTEEREKLVGNVYGALIAAFDEYLKKS
jgi:hypothetical protein